MRRTFRFLPLLLLLAVVQMAPAASRDDAFDPRVEECEEEADREPPEPGPDEHPPGRSTGHPGCGPDLEGLSRDTCYVVGYQAIAFGVMYASTGSSIGWSEEERKGLGAGRWFRNVTHPHFDDDPGYLDYIVHPYWGSTYYLGARDRGFSRTGSFVYAAIASTMFEFGVEALVEPPSIQDLVITPAGGALLGAILEPVLVRIRSRGTERSLGEAVVCCLIDPIGEANHALDRALGFRDRHSLEIRPCRVGRTSGLQLTRCW